MTHEGIAIREVCEKSAEEGSPLVSVVMPCLNEEAAIGICIKKIQDIFSKHSIDGEVVVCDNGSTDNSVAIAESMGVRVVHQERRGYGNAYLKGFENARGKYLVMGDADDTYDFTLIPEFLDCLCRHGQDFVTGSRYLGGGSKHITFLHRICGNPMLTAMLNFFFKTSYSDVYCGFRAFTRTAYDQIKPLTSGMEFNLELAINATKAGLKISEIPIELRPRKGESKLRTFRDGWRSLRMMLLYCPNKVFLWPGFTFFTLGILTHLTVLTRLVEHEGRNLGVVTGIFATIFTVTGFQALVLGLYAKTYTWSRRFEKDDFFLRFFKFFNLETVLASGTAMILIGGTILTQLVWQWFQANLLPLPHPEWASFGATLVILGFETIFSGLLISAMQMKAE